jgi:phosphoserine phosphatase
VGDGANDLPMMGVAGLSVAYHAKPAVRAQAKVSIEQGAWTACWNCCAESSPPA